MIPWTKSNTCTSFIPDMQDCAQERTLLGLWWPRRWWRRRRLAALRGAHARAPTAVPRLEAAARNADDRAKGAPRRGREASERPRISSAPAVMRGAGTGTLQPQQSAEESSAYRAQVARYAAFVWLTHYLVACGVRLPQYNTSSRLLCALR